MCILADCAGGTLAYASACMLDVNDNNRPVAGYINICPSVRLTILLTLLVQFFFLVTCTLSWPVNSNLLSDFTRDNSCNWFLQWFIQLVSLYAYCIAQFLDEETIDGFVTVAKLAIIKIFPPDGLRCYLSIFSLSNYSMKCISVNIFPH